MTSAIDRVNASSSIHQMLEGAARSYGDAIAFENYSNTLSFRQMGDYADALAAYLQTETGVAKGTKVALMSPNCLAHPVATMAILKCGGVQVSVNPMYTPDELEHQLKDSGAEVLLIFAGSIGRFAPIRPKTGIREVLVLSLSDCGQTALPTPTACFKWLKW